MKEKFDNVYWATIRFINRIKVLFWALQPKNFKFWMVKPTTLSIRYHDGRDLYLHSSMKVLCDFYNSQLDSDNVCWDYTEEALHAWEEIKTIAFWWEHIYPTYDLIWNKPDYIISPDTWSVGSSREKHKEYWDWLDRVAAQEVLNDATEEEMVERLAKVYKYLW